MITLSYSISPQLKASLDQIETLRQQILLTPLSPAIELRFRWDAMISRIYWAMVLSAKKIRKDEVVKLTTTGRLRKLGEEERDVILYKRGLDYIDHNWIVSTKALTPDTVLQLHNTISHQQVHRRRGSRYYVSEKSIRYFLDYLQSYPENPVVQAAIAQIQIADIKPFGSYNSSVSRLMALLFLYKYGYDFRGMLVLEEEWGSHRLAFEDIIQKSSEKEKLNPWLEYFARTVVSQLKKAADKISSARFERDTSEAFWKLTDRQREILSLLQEPSATITNRRVQQLFKVSQVTASRDLAKLSTLGLLFVHGKGRSVYYTRV